MILDVIVSASPWVLYCLSLHLAVDWLYSSSVSVSGDLLALLHRGDIRSEIEVLHVEDSLLTGGASKIFGRTYAAQNVLVR